MTFIHEIDGQVIETRHHNRVRREVRHTDGGQVADAFLADDNVSRERFAVGLVFVNDREIFVGQQLTAHNRYKFGIFLINLVNQVVGCIHDQRIEVNVISVFTHTDHSGNNIPFFVDNFAHHAGRRFITVFLQPADGDVLQHRMSGAVRGFGALNAVEPGHDEIERLPLDDGIANTALEVLEARPQIQLFIFEVEVKVDLIALVFFGLQRGKVGGFTLLAAVGVRGAGDGAIDADANFFTLQLIHRHDINFLQKGR